MSRWDRGLDYITVYNLILKHMRRSRGKRKCYDSILLIQLRNGSRISEAVRAYIEYVKTRNSEVKVLVSKKRREVKRLMVIPSEVEICEELLLVDERRLVDRLKHYSLNTFNINTHSLRYAFITYLLKIGTNPAIISKITKHSRLDLILTYTQEKVAEDVLREAV